MPDPSHFSSIGWIVVALGALVLIVNQADDFFKRRAGKDSERTVGPQPFEVTQAKEFVHKKDFEIHAAANTKRHGELFGSIERVERNAAAALKNDVGELRKEVTEIGKQVAGIDTAIDLQNQQLQRIETNLINALRRKA